MKLLLFSFLAGTAFADSLATLGKYQVFEKLSAIPTPWVLRKDQQFDTDLKFKLRIHLKNRNIASFRQKVLDVSTPSHPAYGQHLSKAEVNSMLAPAEDSFTLVAEWLKSKGLSDVATIENDWI